MCEGRSDFFFSFRERKKRNRSSFINCAILCLMLIYIDSVPLNKAVFVSDFIDNELDTN